jgi:signal transduction histidine kinase
MCALFAVVFLAGPDEGYTEQAGLWRVFWTAGKPPVSGFRSVTISENGNIVAVGSADSSFWIFDGYDAKQGPLPDSAATRVWQSPAGQLWTVSPRGLWVKESGPWKLCPVSSGEWPLCPMRLNTVLWLLPGRLAEVNAENPTNARVETLHFSSQTRIGAFADMTAGAAGELWIAGEHGLARVSGPIRSVGAASQWSEFIPPAALQIHHFQNPKSDAAGVTAVADSADESQKVVVRFDGEQWQTWPCGLTKIRLAWRCTDNTFWAASSNALFQIRGSELAANRDVSPCEYFDAALDLRGICWLATSKGMVRFSPRLWQAGIPDTKTKEALEAERAPVELKRLSFSVPDIGTNAGVACMLTTVTGDIWLAGDFGAAWRHDKWTVFPASDTGAPKGIRRLLELPNGQIWCASREKIWSFDGRNWNAVRSVVNHINNLVCARDGSVWIATDNGVERFYRGNWIENGSEEGLSGAVNSICEDQRGGVWAATAGGPRLYHPEADSDPPRTIISTMTDEEKSIPEDGVITIAFSAQDKWQLTPERRMLFSHRLDEGEWSSFDPGTRVAFSDLPAGRHYFQSRAMDRAGNIDPDPAHLEFVVVLPWYKESRLVLIASAGGAVALFFAILAYRRHRQLVLSYAQVEKQVAERTRELGLANQELLQSQKMRALGTLAAGIAHDFNNILSIIKGSAQIIEDNLSDSKKICARTDRIKTVVDQGSSVVQALLGFSRGSNDSLEPCDLNPVVDNTLKLLGDRFQREVEVQFDRAPALPPVRASQSLIQQILLNFIFNAAESMNGRKRIVIATSRLFPLPGEMALPPRPSAAYVAVSVRDFGCGIAPENITRVFEPFFTTKALSTRRGTGLGLSTAYELAKKMEAGLALESTVGQGSVFSLVLPAITPDPPNPSTP